MIRSASFDPSRRLDFNFRINRIGEKTLTFFGSDDLPFSLIYEDFEFFIKRYPGDKQSTISLGLGTGLSIDDNQLIITVTAIQSSITEGEYYYELYKPDDGQTWLSGKAFFHNGPFDASDDSVSIELQPEQSINIYINA